MMPVILSLDTVELTDEQFWRLCQQNRDFQLERSARGELIVMSPVGGKSGNQEAGLISFLWLWNQQTGLGKVFSSSTIFKLPGGGDRSPDAAWVKLQQKMQEYLDSGLLLGWLINPQDKQVEIYRPNQAVEIVKYPVDLSGEEVLPGFILKLPF